MAIVRSGEMVLHLYAGSTIQCAVRSKKPHNLPGVRILILASSQVLVAFDRTAHAREDATRVRR